MNEQQQLAPIAIPFFNSRKLYCKVYNDGSHYVGTLYRPTLKLPPERKPKTEMQKLFAELYAQAAAYGEKRAETLKSIREQLQPQFKDETALDAFIAAEMKRTAHNVGVRKKRFSRKAYFNEWHYFVTVTYSDEKHTEETFRKQFRRCLSNLHTRRQWLYMGVFERAPETNRLHFHGLFYIPDGQMIGTVNEKRDYSKKSRTMQTTHENDFFAERFGRNDFSEIYEADLQYGNTLAYLLKYIGKTGERIVYSRGIPDGIMTHIDIKDIAAEIPDDYVTKYVLFDDVFDKRK